jgi:hypothetical protein
MALLRGRVSMMGKFQMDRRSCVRLAVGGTVMGLGVPAWATAPAAGRPVLRVGRPSATGGAPELTLFTDAQLSAMPQTTITTRTPWYERARRFTGPLMSQVLQAAGAQGRVVKATALNDYSVEIPMADITDHGVVLARLLDDQPMPVRDRGPLFVIYPFDDKPAVRTPVHFARCIWQLRSLDVLP